MVKKLLIIALVTNIASADEYINGDTAEFTAAYNVSFYTSCQLIYGLEGNRELIYLNEIETLKWKIVVDEIIDDEPNIYELNQMIAGDKAARILNAHATIADDFTDMKKSCISKE